MFSSSKFSTKHPDDILDYVVDFAGNDNNTGLTNWLKEGEQITTADVLSEPSGLTITLVEIVNAGTSVKFWASGGLDGIDYTVTVVIETNLSPTKKNVPRIIPVRA